MIFNLTKNIEGKIYLFFDEIQHVTNWEVSINEYRIDMDSDIYVTGSYSNLIKGVNRSILSGSYIRINMYPFSYKELLTYFSDKKKSALTHDDEIKIFNNYLNYGGFPGLLAYDYPDEKITYLTDIYNSIMLKDVIDIGKIFSANSIAKYLKLEKYNISTSTVLNYKVCYEFITFISDKKRRSYWKKNT